MILKYKMKNFIIRLFRIVINSWKEAFTLNIDKEAKKEVMKTFIYSILLFIVIWAFFKFVVSGSKPVAKSEPETIVTDTVELWYLNGMKDTIEIERPIDGKYKLEYSVAHNHYLVLTDKQGFYIKDFQNVINYKILNNEQTKK